MIENSIASRVIVRRRYVRSVDVARDVDDPEALDGYVITPSVREAAFRILAALSANSRQRAFRVVGPYGAGKSAFGVFLAQLLRESGRGPATSLLFEATGSAVEDAAWRPVIVTGRRVSFARELVRVVTRDAGPLPSDTFDALNARAASMLERDTPLDAHAVVEFIGEMAAEMRAQTGEGLLLLIDEMGRFLEHAAANHDTEDPSIFQLLAERSGGRDGVDLAIVAFLHHRFADYVAGMGGWIEAEWSRSSERYEELSFGGSTEQSLFMLAHALESLQPHSEPVRQQAEEIYGEAADRGLFVVPREEVVKIAPNLYPLHPAAVAALALAIRRFGQHERSLFGFLQSLEPASFRRFSHSIAYGADNWYRVPALFDHVAATASEVPGGDRARRWSLAFDGVAAAASLDSEHQNVLKAVALVAVLEPLPGMVADARTIAWSLSIDEARVQPILNELAKRNLIYRRLHRGDYSLWSSSSVDLSHWLKQARLNARAPERFHDISDLLVSQRPVVAHRHYHSTGTLRTFEIQLWTGGDVRTRSADGLILVVPVYPGESRQQVLREASAVVEKDPLALVCARAVAPEDLKWAHELTLWSWVRDNCDELKVDELAHMEVSERISSAQRALMSATAILSAAKGVRDETWWFEGEPVAVPPDGLSVLLSTVCDSVYDEAPVLKNELINRAKLSSAVASARMRLLDRMLTCADQVQLGMEGAPPERTIYRSMFLASGIHRQNLHGRFSFGAPPCDDPCRWMPVWERIERQLSDTNAVSLSVLIADLAAPPYGLRAGPALLIIAAFVLASKDKVAVMERNTFQVDLTVAHFMRLSKSPRNFALKSLREGAGQKGILWALASRLSAIGDCQPTITGISEKLFTWFNALPPYTLSTGTVSSTAKAVRGTLRKASEPGNLFYRDLPVACDAVTEHGTVDVDRYAGSLDNALLELHHATPSLRSRATQAALHAFGATDVAKLRIQIQSDYGPHRLDLTDYRLRAFVERAMNVEATPDRWLDGIAGHLVGKRPDNWADDALDKFDFEIRVVAGNLARWLALARRRRQAGSADLKSVHVVDTGGREQVIVVRRDRPNPFLEKRLAAVRNALGDDANRAEVLAQLLAEYANDSTAGVDEKKVERS